VFQHNFALDRAQFTVATLPWSSIGLGVVAAIFGLVGFECATAFGDAAKKPLKTIPRAVSLSLVIAGAFLSSSFMSRSWRVRGYATSLDKIDAPLNVLATLALCRRFR
jgi:amino acid transporter